ncbi:DUF6090 family protein [Geojedonia litorea]|uniref:DUF6090 family protein n=1 Tax=Geojedonia litorea TaxID=1268269 RepID=A0ABV9N518_9FLAO
MGKNKTGKYLKYAIGEIVLVVIGILIALSINKYNQDKIIKKKEQVYLVQLKKEFIDKKNTLSKMIERNKNNYTAAKELVEILNSKTPITDEKLIKKEITKG